ncbi:hypothetical protein DSO57_1009923 [Entomophthora muscae]|uniref:Uncharacterized protein n=1 Tax=Entomophthora muscae TaxID=34485 RepID=A0ACC2SVH5_9FUNG|nr:hypothetical protein DSO57_1009923 [Entomophthora muscae]
MLPGFLLVLFFSNCHGFSLWKTSSPPKKVIGRHTQEICKDEFTESKHKALSEGYKSMVTSLEPGYLTYETVPNFFKTYCVQLTCHQCYSTTQISRLGMSLWAYAKNKCSRNTLVDRKDANCKCILKYLENNCQTKDEFRKKYVKNKQLK